MAAKAEKLARYPLLGAGRTSMNNRLPKWAWLIITVAMIITLGVIDWLTGYELTFFVFYFLPVALGAWMLGLEASIALAVLGGLVWFGADVLSGQTYSSHFYAVWNTAVRFVSFLVIGWSVAKLKEMLDRERETAASLRKALSEVKVLESFLPICAQCKKIRNKEGEWQQLESYIGEHSNTQFTHGYCPECARKALEEAGLINKKTKPFPNL
jgi:hypothetical protein